MAGFKGFDDYRSKDAVPIIIPDNPMRDQAQAFEEINRPWPTDGNSAWDKHERFEKSIERGGATLNKEDC